MICEKLVEWLVINGLFPSFNAILRPVQRLIPIVSQFGIAASQITLSVNRLFFLHKGLKDKFLKNSFKSNRGDSPS
jgi:hypothetical protein